MINGFELKPYFQLNIMNYGPLTLRFNLDLAWIIHKLEKIRSVFTCNCIGCIDL